MSPSKKLDILSKLTTASVSDVLNGKGVMNSSIKAMGSIEKIIGRAFTASTPPGDMLTCYWALHEAPRGSVLVIQGGGYRESAIWGSLMTYEAKKKGLAGVVIDGALRDIKSIKVLEFPIFAVTATPRDGTISGIGELEVPIHCGGASVKPGDYIIADDDGVVAIPANIIEKVLEKASEATEMEERIIKELKQGKSLFDLFSLKDLVIKKEREDVKLMNELIRDLGF